MAAHKTTALPLALAYAALIVYASLYPFADWRDQGIVPWAYLAAAWPKDNGALNGVMIQALARLYRNNKAAISEERMIAKLHGKDCKILTADAEALRKMGGGDAPLAVAKALVEIYNKQLTANLIQLGAKA